jgi:hypothetical protein
MGCAVKFCVMYELDISFFVLRMIQMTIHAAIEHNTDVTPGGDGRQKSTHEKK